MLNKVGRGREVYIHEKERMVGEFVKRDSRTETSIFSFEDTHTSISHQCVLLLDCFRLLPLKTCVCACVCVCVCVCVYVCVLCAV